ncbi:GNAT family N-acetyltransferase [Streptomyces sp. NPDC004647]|uniref:GNAT family N-acetyltransferase n=1 Tax=Streptomyces sp. NPDC004647 TaxID=3154671 RepID=UPI0033A2CE23
MTLLRTVPIRRLSRADLTRCLDLSADRGRPADDRSWQLLLTAGAGHGIDDPDGDGLIGSYVLTRYGPELACMSRLLVAERHARRGLGRRLMAHALEEAGGTPVLGYATDLARPLYEHHGFTAVTRSTTYAGRFRPESGASGPSEESDATRPAAAADLPAVLRLDAEVFGSDRMQLLTRLPAFADRFRVAEDRRGLTGFAAAWRSADDTVIGPVVAGNTTTARRLIADLAGPTEGAVRLDVDDRHTELAAWLADRGVAPVTASTVMVHGAAGLPGDHGRRFAPLMVALG